VRTAYVISACGDDADVRVEVQSLLDSHLQAKRFLSEPAAAPAETDVDRVRSRLGAYEVDKPPMLRT
jgi:hypothetical protein